MTNRAEIEIEEPEWFSEIKPVAVLTLSPEDVWEVMPDGKKNTMAKGEFIGIFNEAAERLSDATDAYWDTIRDAIDDKGL